MIDIPQLIEWGYWLVPWSRDPRRPLVRDWKNKKPDALGFHRAYGDSIDWAIVPCAGVVVLDIEMKNGLDGVRDLLDLIGDEDLHCLDWWIQTRTKSNGRHYWFRQPVGKELVGGHYLAPGVEAKALTGSVHIPPSTGYRWITPLTEPILLPTLPKRLLEAWERTAKIKSNGASIYKAEIYAMGERRSRLCSMAGRLRQAGLTEPELVAALLSVRDTRCEDPPSFSDAEIVGIAKDYARKPERTEPDTSWFPSA